MNTTLDRTLELFAQDAARDADVSAAQRKLDAAIAARAAARPARTPRRIAGWLAATTTAVVAVVTLISLPLASAPAFAEVQRHFRDFRTLRFDMTQRMGDEPLMTSRVSMNRAGDVRTDVGDDVTVIVNHAEQRVLILSHDARTAGVMPLDATGKSNDSLEWLDELREFKGAAKPLDRTRLIGGRWAKGWELDAAGTRIELWADQDGLPLEMNVDAGGSELRLDFRFEFNAKMAPETFSTAVPAGYTLAPAED